MSKETKRYLGDGVYASFDSYQIWLETSNGIRVTNRIALDPSVYNKLLEFAKDLRAGKIGILA